MTRGTRSVGQQKSDAIVSDSNENSARMGDFVLEKSIFSTVFEKDVRRVFIYKKAERLAKALGLITPAFTGSPALKSRLDTIAVELVDAAMLPPRVARERLSRELLTLSSVLGIARSGGLLSPMNADLISHEAQVFLHEVAIYEEPRLTLDETPTLPSIARQTARALPSSPARAESRSREGTPAQERGGNIKDRRSAVLAIIKDKGTVGIKDISTLVRGVSEKTVQRELVALVRDGVVEKSGERRWSVYSLA